jgi:hypothetical protein
MKRLARTITTVGFSALLVLPSIGSPKAQSLDNLKVSPENLIELTALAGQLDVTPRQVILVYDSGNLTLELNDLENIAVLPGVSVNNYSAMHYSADYAVNEVVTEEEIMIEDWMLNPFSKKAEEAEEEIKLESWMMHPEEWKTK